MNEKNLNKISKELKEASDLYHNAFGEYFFENMTEEEVMNIEDSTMHLIYDMNCYIEEKDKIESGIRVVCGIEYKKKIKLYNKVILQFIEMEIAENVNSAALVSLLPFVSDIWFNESMLKVKITSEKAGIEIANIGATEYGRNDKEGIFWAKWW